MSGCCETGCAADALREKQRGTLQAVLAINAVMFVVILVAAQYARSTALFADSLQVSPLPGRLSTNCLTLTCLYLN